MSSKYNGKTFEWDRPGIGIYSDGSIRIITRRDSNGIFACHKADDKEVKFIMLLEKLQIESNTKINEILVQALYSDLKSLL